MQVFLFEACFLCRAEHIPVNRSILRDKAEELSRKFGVKGWRCSDGWLRRWKRRHGINYTSLSGETKRECVVKQTVDSGIEAPPTATADLDSDDEDCGVLKETASKSTVVGCVQKLNLFCMQADCDDSVLKPFNASRDALDERFACSGKQSKLTPFFKKREEHGVRQRKEGTRKDDGGNWEGKTWDGGMREDIGAEEEEQNSERGEEGKTGGREEQNSERGEEGRTEGGEEQNSERREEGRTGGREEQNSERREEGRTGGREEQNGERREEGMTEGREEEQNSERGEGRQRVGEELTAKEVTRICQTKDGWFQILRHELNECKSVEEIVDFSVYYQEIIKKYPVSMCHFLADGVKKDGDSELWLPDDIQHVTPMHICNDGNCLSRCASMMAYGHQNHHIEMRIRIVIEMAANLEQYLDNVHLQGGECLKDDLPKTYAMYSNHFRHGQQLTPASIKDVLCREIETITIHGSCMGMWQVHAISNIFQSKLPSIYPQFGGATVRQHLNRWVTPFSRPSSPQSITWSPFAVMWTSTRGKHQEPHKWRVNHFVVCVCRC